MCWNHPNHGAVWQETEMASSLVAGFTEVVWASWRKNHKSRFKWRWFQHYRHDRNAKCNSIDRLYQTLNCICTENICRVSQHFQFFVGVEAKATWHPGLSQWWPLFVDSKGQVVRSQNRTKCVKYVWLSYPTWPSKWVLCISVQWLRLKGCHVACDEWTSGEICSLQHMWVTGSVMWAAPSDESLKFGVQGASATKWFPRVNGARDNGIRLWYSVHTKDSLNLTLVGQATSWIYL